EPARCPARAEDLDFKATVRACELRGDVSKRDGCLGAVSISARRYRTNHLAIVPDGLIAAGIRVGSSNRECYEAQGATVLLLLERCRAPDEVALIEIDKTAETRFIRPVDRAKFPRPGTETFLEPHGVQGTRANEPQAMCVSSLYKKIVQGALVVIRDPDFIAEVAGEGYAPHQCRHHANVHALEGEKRKRIIGQIFAHQTLQECAGAGSGNRH